MYNFLSPNVTYCALTFHYDFDIKSMRYLITIIKVLVLFVTTSEIIQRESKSINYVEIKI